MALVVFTGGARSGKSAAALGLARSRAAEVREVVWAVFGRPEDAEMTVRIARHRAERPASFRTLEVGAGSLRTWLELVDAPAAVGDADEDEHGPDAEDDPPLLVLDCLGTLLGLVMERAWAESGASLTEADALELPQGLAERIEAEFTEIVEGLAGRAGDTVVVTNEVGSGVVPEWASARLFRDVLGRANRLLTERADAAYLCVAGRLIDLERLPRDAAWPHD